MVLLIIYKRQTGFVFLFLFMMPVNLSVFRKVIKLVYQYLMMDSIINYCKNLY